MGVGYGIGMQVYLIVFFVVFIIIFITIVARFVSTGVRSAAQWNKNNHSPKLTVDAAVVGRRQQVSRHQHGCEMHHAYTSTIYFVTFEVDSGDRMEFEIPSSEYGYLIEGDHGQLTFQGTRYLSFQRH